MSESDHHDTQADFERDLDSHDQWFRHDAAPADLHASSGETNGFKIIIFLFVVIALVFGTAGALIVYFKVEVKDQIVESEKRFTSPQLTQAQDAWSEQLSTYGIAKEETGTYHIPLDRAIELTIEDYASNR